MIEEIKEKISELME